MVFWSVYGTYIHKYICVVSEQMCNLPIYCYFIPLVVNYILFSLVLVIKDQYKFRYVWWKSNPLTLKLVAKWSVDRHKHETICFCTVFCSATLIVMTCHRHLQNCWQTFLGSRRVRAETDYNNLRKRLLLNISRRR